jgi:O-antigen/teichoic acid export membrane protein
MAILSFGLDCGMDSGHGSYYLGWRAAYAPEGLKNSANAHDVGVSLSVLSIRRQFALSYAQKYLSILLQFASMVIIARLLGPDEVGMFALAVAYVALATVLAELGQQDYLIQAQSLNSGQEKAAFGLAWLSSWICAAVTALLAFILVAPGQGPFRSIILTLALALCLKPFSLLMRGRLMRQLSFQRLAIVNATRDVISSAGTILFVYMGFGPTGLALGLLLEEVVMVAWAAFHHYRSGWVRPSLLGAQELLHFGFFRSGVYALGALGDSASRLVMGALLGAGALGLVNRAQKITAIFDKVVLEGFMPVLLPYLTSQLREGGDIRRELEHKAVMLSGIAWPFFGFVALAAEPIVALLLGERWAAAAPVLRILSLGGLALPISAGMYLFLTAMGLLRPFLPWQLVAQVLVVAMAWLGSLAGLEWACVAFVLGHWLKAMATLHIIRRRTGMTLDVLRPSIRASGSLMLFTTAVTVAGLQLPLPPVWLALVCGVQFAAGWLLGIYLVKHPLSVEVTTLAKRIASGVVTGKAFER